MYAGKRCARVPSVGCPAYGLSIIFVLRDFSRKYSKNIPSPSFWRLPRTHVQVERVELILLHEVLELSLQPRSTIPVGHVQHSGAPHRFICGQRRHVTLFARLSDLRVAKHKRCVEKIVVQTTYNRIGRTDKTRKCKQTKSPYTCCVNATANKINRWGQQLRMKRGYSGTAHRSLYRYL